MKSPRTTLWTLAALVAILTTSLLAIPALVGKVLGQGYFEALLLCTVAYCLLPLRRLHTPKATAVLWAAVGALAAALVFLI